MATISFTNLNENFSIADYLNVSFSSFIAGTTAFFRYGSANGDRVTFYGQGIVNNGVVPTNGTVQGIEIDLGGDDLLFTEIVVSGFFIPATSFALGVGTFAEQGNRFWSLALAGDDVISLAMADYTRDFTFAGDGLDTTAFFGVQRSGSDSFIDGGAPLTGLSRLIGDFIEVLESVCIGGADVFTAGANQIFGDFRLVHRNSGGVGGDDVIAPARLSNFGALPQFLGVGDAERTWGLLKGGDDFIDLRSTIMPGFANAILLVGDAVYVDADFNRGALLGGDDTIHGSPVADAIYGAIFFGYAEGGKDRLYGYGGNDAIFGNEGRDFLAGGDNDDSLNGGLDGDVIDGGLGNDSMIGDAGNDLMLGGDGADTMIAGAGADMISGGTGNDVADAGAGADAMQAGNGKDSLFGGTGDDAIDSGIGNDTLSGGDNNDALVGGAGFDVLVGGNGDDTLDGGAENDQLYGNAGADTFRLATGFGTDAIRDFAAGAGVGDVIRLVLGTAFDNFAEAMAAATDNGADTTFNFGGGNTLVVKGVLVAQFSADDFAYG